MPEPISHPDDSCSYERQTPGRHPWRQRRHQLLHWAWIWLSCSGFAWPGRVPHLSYQAAHGAVSERVEALRLLEEYPSQASSDACLAGLEDGASEVRTQAAQCVGAAGDDRATSNLLDLASSKDPAERAAALEALGRLAPARALPVIEPALADPRPTVRVAAIRALTAYVRAGSFDVAQLAPLFRSELPHERLAAIELLAAAPSRELEPGSSPPAAAGGAALSKQRDPGGAGQNPTQAAHARALQLRAAVHDPAAVVRAAVLRVMGRTRDATLLHDLSTALADPDEVVRLSAIAALGDSNLPGATPALRTLSAGTLSQSSQLRAARSALAALGRIDDPSALPPIAAALMRPELTESAGHALIARARRLNQPDSFRHCAAALQRAIDATGEPHTNAVGDATRIRATTHADHGARARAGAQVAGAPEADGPTRAPEADAPTRAPEADAPTRAPEADGPTMNAADAALDALARTALELAPFTDVQPAEVGLRRALAAGRGEVYSLTQHLISLAAYTRGAGELGDRRAAGNQADRSMLLMPALLERDAATSPRMAAAALAVLEASPDARALLAAHREELQRLAAARPATTPEAVKLHALLHVSLTETSLEARRALAELWAAQPALAAERDHVDRLVRWLDDTVPEVRERSSVALGRAADLTTLEALSARLARGAPYPELTLRACAGALHRASPQLRERLLQQLQSYLTHADETVAMSALFALRAADDQRSAPWIAGLLRGSSTQLRAAAVQALSGFDQPEARRMLRDMLRGDNIQNASNAALALAELGSDRDVEALLRAAERGSWPLPPAAAYAAARITARGVTRKHSLERVLCRFAQLRDSYVLSNIVSALATLGADACDEQVDPKKLLASTLPSSLRVAAALWLQSTRPRSPAESAEQSALLARCASDHDKAVAAACKPRTAQAESSGQTLLRVFELDSRSVLRNRVVALGQPDGTVFVGQSDNNGLVLLPRALAGEIRLEDPADQGPVAFPARAPGPASP